MNFFGTAPINKPVIKKVSVSVPAPRIARPAISQSNRPSPVAHRPATKPAKRAQSPKARIKKQALKRKASTPLFSDNDDDDDSGVESSASSLDARKRVRSSVSSVDSNRRLADVRKRADGGKFAFVHGAHLVSGGSGKSYKPLFEGEERTCVKLQYPGESLREKFTLVWNDVRNDYQPLDDIRETIKFVCKNYLPEAQAAICLDDENGLERRLIRAGKTGSFAEYAAVVDDYNKMITKAREDGTVTRELLSKHSLGLDWIQRILDQVYSRTVSPQVESLRAYQNGTDNVYGELLPPLVSEMFREAELKSEHVFVDLGSGVGNVVLQAALEVGCESWGCEIMENPCKLAELQAKEFPARARMWGLNVGKIHLLKGDFIESKLIGDVLKKADVVLVNNQAFNPDLNDKLMHRFLDLKDGCRIISLKPFKPDGFELKEWNAGDPRHLLTDERKLPFYSSSVSWTDAPGEYHIVRKDPARLHAFFKSREGRSRRGEA